MLVKNLCLKFTALALLLPFWFFILRPESVPIVFIRKGYDRSDLKSNFAKYYIVAGHFLGRNSVNKK